MVYASLLSSTVRLGLPHAAPALACGILAASHQQQRQQQQRSSILAGNIHLAGTATACEAATATGAGSRKRPIDKGIVVRRRMTSVGRFSLLSETRTNPSIPVMVMAMSGEAWKPSDFLNLYKDCKIAEKHERFQATLEDPNDPSHFVNPQNFVPPVDEFPTYPVVYRSELKDWIVEAIIQPMDLKQSLWQARTATAGALGQSGAIRRERVEQLLKSGATFPSTVESLMLFRAHHCMADGVSLGALFGTLVDEGGEFQETLENAILDYHRQKKKKTFWQKLQMFVFYWGFGSIQSVLYHFYLFLQSLIAPNPWKLLKQDYNLKLKTQEKDEQQQHAQPPARTLSWAEVAPLDEVKTLAAHFSQKAQGKVTVNDIFCSCVSGAIARLVRYQQSQHPDLNLRLPYANLVIPVHMQGGVLLPGQSMGNKIGALVNRVPSQAVNDAEDRLYEVHATLWQNKRTPAAVISFVMAKLAGSLHFSVGRWTPWFFESAHANASVVVTNIRGPDKTVHLKGRRVESVLSFLPLPPGIPIGMVVQSYANRVTLTVTAEPWAVPDADLFLSWVVEEYQALAAAAAAAVSSTKPRPR